MLKIEAQRISCNSISNLLEITPCYTGVDFLLQNMFLGIQLTSGKGVRSSKITGCFGREFLPC